jgi:hypothetical protein
VIAPGLTMFRVSVPMGEARPFEAEKLIVAVLMSEANFARPGFWEQLRDGLAERFGPVDYISPPLPFAFTRYYDAELGSPLVRLFVAFRELVDPQTLARLKTATNALEDELRQPTAIPGSAGHAQGGEADAQGPRSVNLDPGLLSLSRLILASTKDSSHRIPLANGIFAEITLQYRRPTFEPVPWTYPDYRSEGVLKVLLEIRNLLKAQRRGRNDEPGRCGSMDDSTGPPLR